MPAMSVKPKARETPRNPTPREVPFSLAPKSAANSAVPMEPKTRRNVPRASAISFVAVPGVAEVSAICGSFRLARI